MAMLVCFHEGGSAVDWSRKAIYLDQGLYELLYRYFCSRDSNSVMRRIVAIGYDEELIVSGSQLIELGQELHQILADEVVQHPQLAQLHMVVQDAVLKGMALAFGGDMYPDLSRK
jgi:hypothetical protein